MSHKRLNATPPSGIITAPSPDSAWLITTAPSGDSGSRKGVAGRYVYATPSLTFPCMASIYCDQHLKEVVQARVSALSDPDEGVLVSEQAALVDMLDSQYQTEYARRRAENMR